MRTGLGQSQDRGILAPAGDPGVPVTIAATAKEIPYDYVATLQLAGQFGNRVQDVINVSVDGAFVAVAIGYSFLPARDVIAPQPPPQNPLIAARQAIIQRRNQIQASLGTGWLALFAAVRAALGTGAAAAAEFEEAVRAATIRLRGGVDFLYSIVDSATGRELQNQPIHSMAGLGNAMGERPFRMFAKPMLFMPRSSIRIEIIEQSQGPFYQGGQLYFVLHGYKLLGYGAPQP